MEGRYLFKGITTSHTNCNGSALYSISASANTLGRIGLLAVTNQNFTVDMNKIVRQLVISILLVITSLVSLFLPVYPLLEVCLSTGRYSRG